MRKGVNLPRDAAVGEQFWRAEVVRDAPPPLRETDVTEGDMGGGGAIAYWCLYRPPLLMDYLMCSGKKYPFVVDLT
jgi:hypothetical protein